MTERELFDEWYGKKPKGWFEAIRYNTAWRAWQASANRQGYKLVPVDDLHSIHNELAEEHPNYHLVFSILQRHLEQW